MSTDATYWNGRYQAGHSSGPGSADGPVQRKVDWLAQLDGIRNISEIGCGDFNLGRHLVAKIPNVTYRGYDISKAIVGRNQAEFGDDGVNFYTADRFVTPADLLMCVDVIFHVSEWTDLRDLIETLHRKWTKYLAVSAYEYDGHRKGHVHIRKFDPSFFGVPILREIIEDDGEMYFYIFKK